MPFDFLENNYERLKKKLKNVLYKSREIITTTCFDEDLIHEAILKLYQRCGNIVMNFSFDISILFNILAVKAKYIMINSYLKNYYSHNNANFENY